LAQVSVIDVGYHSDGLRRFKAPSKEAADLVQHYSSTVHP